MINKIKNGFKVNAPCPNDIQQVCNLLWDLLPSVLGERAGVVPAQNGDDIYLYWGQQDEENLAHENEHSFKIKKKQSHFELVSSQSIFA